MLSDWLVRVYGRVCAAIVCRFSPVEN